MFKKLDIKKKKKEKRKKKKEKQYIQKVIRLLFISIPKLNSHFASIHISVKLVFSKIWLSKLKNRNNNTGGKERKGDRVGIEGTG
jgi:hypothetical protein